MEGKFFQENWNEMRGRISEWWDDLTDEDLDKINGSQEQLVMTLRERYGYTKNLAFLEVKIRMASCHPEGEGRAKRFNNKDGRALQYSSCDDDDWLEINNGRGLHGSGKKFRTRNFTDHYNEEF